MLQFFCLVVVYVFCTLIVVCCRERLIRISIQHCFRKTALCLFAVDCLVPSEPRIMHILSRNGTAVMIKWAAPVHRNGMLLGYQLYVLYSEQNQDKTSVINITDNHSNIFQITGLSMQHFCCKKLHTYLLALMYVIR